MAKKAKRFRIGVEGATTDGRTIERVWLEQMAANYNPQLYTAVINLEHIKGYTPDSPFRRFGTVDRLEAEEINDGPLKGKLALYGWITPTDELVSMTAKLQKIFTSMEVNPKFADTGEAYLVGLAVTDDPASLGTEMLQFSSSAPHNPLARRKQDESNLFTAAEETLIEFEDDQTFFTRVKDLLSRKKADDNANFADVHRAVEAVAVEVSTTGENFASFKADLTQRLEALEQSQQQQATDFTALREELSTQDSRGDRRPHSTGGNGGNEALTNC
ncbi:GPO family capsid scaffolding protein [Franconibacter helveticus 513]|uniref:GPO family capsid scaffolding protein n=1 Tax=Franconibacter helveticus TaxID=357240 RepID=UPI0003F53DDC|nr:GPO family capsid scaffolding protein [Franconibacter helveticus]EKY3119567.1 GPO family capsid scaffolding protein [Cronobacter turicensis]ELY4111902.1 GPO family capsid scaffolding protein [Cronobacter turicensis]